MPLDACYSLDQTLRLLSIPSPTGYPRQVCGALVETLEGLGFSPRQLRKGGVVCPLGGEGRPLALAAHVDTLGLMVRAVKPDGRLAFTCLGGPSLQAVDDTTLEILLDEEVSSREDVERLGIAVGDIVCLDPRARVTESGFIRSRFLDDKLSAGMLLTLARGVAEGTVRLSRKVTLFFSVYEEVGHGASCGLPEDTEDLLVVDMGCVGEGLSCREQQVSICAKDSSGPYDYEMTGELIALAKSNGIDYAVDVYPAYGSDAAAALRAGRDVRFALIGAGVYASHGYERSHRKGVENTLRLIEAVVTA